MSPLDVANIIINLWSGSDRVATVSPTLAQITAISCEQNVRELPELKEQVDTRRVWTVDTWKKVICTG